MPSVNPLRTHQILSLQKHAYSETQVLALSYKYMELVHTGCNCDTVTVEYYQLDQQADKGEMILRLAPRSPLPQQVRGKTPNGTRTISAFILRR